MHPEKFGDSYDIVKRSLLEWLSACGTWAVHPMFADPAPPGFPEEFETFLGAPLVTTDPVPGRGERVSYFEGLAEWRSTDHLFLDPDTGISLPGSRAEQQHLMAEELVQIVQGRKGMLTLVFDQGFPRVITQEDRKLRTWQKLAWLHRHGVYSLVYYSHANFVLASSDKEALRSAEFTLEAESRLPRSRLITHEDA